MSTSKAHAHAARILLRSLDDFDLTAFHRDTICAVLLPESLAACYSASLTENASTVSRVTPHKVLPSPGNSDSEDDSVDNFEQGSQDNSMNNSEDGLKEDSENDDGLKRRASAPNDLEGSTQLTGERDDTRRVIVLEQFRDEEKFTFGSAQGNKVVLRNPISKTEKDLCFVNLLHLELYPDPDRDALVLNNPSTSDFTLRDPLKPLAAGVTVIPSHQSTINKGTWRLTLGKGWSFQIKVLPRAPRVFTGLIISPTAAAPRASTSKTTSVKSTQTTYKPKVSTLSTTNTKPSQKNKAKAGHMVTIPYIEQGVDVPNEASPDSPVAIGQTAFTQVFKVIRRGTTVAVKISQKPDLIQSAKMWKTEQSILARLDHVSKASKYSTILSL